MAVLSCCAGSASGLKLTPVHQMSQRVDISAEAQVLSTAFAEANRYLQSEGSFLEKGLRTEEGISRLLGSHAIRRLQNSIERWTRLRARLQQTSVNQSLIQQFRAYEDAINHEAASKALIGRLHYFAGDHYIALEQLESACPVLWKYEATLSSIYIQGWADCFLSLSDIYIRMGDERKLDQMGRQISTSMPWLPIAMHLRPDTTPEALLEALAGIANDDLEILTNVMRTAWLAAMDVRRKLNMLTREFVWAEGGKRRQLSVIMHAQEAMQRDIEYFSIMANEIATIAGDARSFDSHALLAEMRSILGAEAKQYAAIMEALMGGGEAYLTDALRALESKEKAAIDMDTKPQTKAPETDAPALSHHRPAPLGFQSDEDILRVFLNTYKEFAEKQYDGSASVPSSFGDGEYISTAETSHVRTSTGGRAKRRSAKGSNREGTSASEGRETYKKHDRVGEKARGDGGDTSRSHPASRAPTQSDRRPGSSNTPNQSTYLSYCIGAAVCMAAYAYYTMVEKLTGGRRSRASTSFAMPTVGSIKKILVHRYEYLKLLNRKSIEQGFRHTARAAYTRCVVVMRYVVAKARRLSKTGARYAGLSGKNKENNSFVKALQRAIGRLALQLHVGAQDASEAYKSIPRRQSSKDDKVISEHHEAYLPTEKGKKSKNKCRSISEDVKGGKVGKIMKNKSKSRSASEGVACDKAYVNSATQAEEYVSSAVRCHNDVLGDARVPESIIQGATEFAPVDEHESNSLALDDTEGCKLQKENETAPLYSQRSGSGMDVSLSQWVDEETKGRALKSIAQSEEGGWVQSGATSRGKGRNQSEAGPARRAQQREKIIEQRRMRDQLIRKLEDSKSSKGQLESAKKERPRASSLRNQDRNDRSEKKAGPAVGVGMAAAGRESNTQKQQHSAKVMRTAESPIPVASGTMTSNTGVARLSGQQQRNAPPPHVTKSSCSAPSSTETLTLAERLKTKLSAGSRLPPTEKTDHPTLSSVGLATELPESQESHDFSGSGSQTDHEDRSEDSMSEHSARGDEGGDDEAREDVQTLHHTHNMHEKWDSHGDESRQTKPIACHNEAPQLASTVPMTTYPPQNEYLGVQNAAVPTTTRPVSSSSHEENAAPILSPVSIHPSNIPAAANPLQSTPTLQGAATEVVGPFFQENAPVNMAPMAGPISPHGIDQVTLPRVGQVGHLQGSQMAPELSAPVPHVGMQMGLQVHSPQNVVYYAPYDLHTHVQGMPVQYQYAYYPAMVPAHASAASVSLMHQHQHQQQQQHNHRHNQRAQPMNTQRSAVAAIKTQIEYYFSPQNLVKDTYLRGKMDSEGYVNLGEIARFRRVQNFHPSPSMMLQAILSSDKLEVVESDDAEGVKEAVYNTKIRCIDDPLKWVAVRGGMGLSMSRSPSPSSRVHEEGQLGVR